MVASLTKRAGDWHGIGTTFFTLAYTWSHLIDDGTGIFRNTSQVPYYNHHQFHGTGDNDVRNRFVFSGGWTMPWNKAWKGGPAWLTQGWTLYPIVVAQSGLPMDVNGGLYLDGTPGASGAGDQGLLKPNWVGGPPKGFNPHNYQTIGGLTGNFIFDPTGLSLPDCYYTSLSDGTVCSEFQRTGNAGRMHNGDLRHIAEEFLPRTGARQLRPGTS
jgi:hypothetical protein